MNSDPGGAEENGSGNDPLDSPGSELAHFMLYAYSWSAVVQGGYGIGPLSPTLLLSAWRSYLWRGLSDHISVYITTAHRRTVYLPGPHDDEVPRGFSLRGNRVGVCGLDERGSEVNLRGLSLSEVNGYLFVSNPY
ncbi:hypothetical protein [Deinococcus sp. QL22]|uniref:hypothetical protein n=1 Tax=Deinococcus sp. QL22 TaxID=2939437 RepID=UPI002017EE79|nr:hypothetical protein [Deinococcus sp. QL22]UQN10272.1 hypothetical protein M1R55_28275 [Deinococcus sp. QL22]